MSKEDERGGASFLRGRFDFPSVGEMIAFVPEVFFFFLFFFLSFFLLSLFFLFLFSKS